MTDSRHNEETDTEYTAIESTVLEGLAEKLQRALELRDAEDDDAAEELLRSIITTEPRLAEPRLELAHIAVGREDWDEAEGQAREAVEILQRGGQWTLEIDPDVFLAFAYNLLGEILVRSIDGTDLIESDRDAFMKTWNAAAQAFEEAYQLDPDNEDIASNFGRVRPV